MTLASFPLTEWGLDWPLRSEVMVLKLRLTGLLAGLVSVCVQCGGLQLVGVEVLQTEVLS